MLLILTTILMLFQGGRAQQYYSDFTINRINTFRSLRLLSLLGLPVSSSMFALEGDTYLELYAAINADGTCQSINFFPPGGSLNFYTASLPADAVPQSNIEEALLNWLSSVSDETSYPGNFTYTNTQQKELANMLYYKSTKAGCAYIACNTTQPPVFAVTCVFNSAPQLGEPVYIASQNDGCSKDSDCSEYLPHSKCATVESGREIQGLCYAGNVTTFSSSTTTTTTTTASPTTTTAASRRPTTTTTTTSPTTTTTASRRPTTTTTTASLTTTTFPSPMSPMTSAIRTKIIDMHNYRRSRLAQGLVPNGLSGQYAPQGANIYSMTYSTDLENDAQKYADGCPFSGSSSASRSSGENFGLVSINNATSYYDAVFHALQSFWRVIKSTSINNEMVFTSDIQQRNQALLRFTQMAWANTYQVGCGAMLCDDYYVVVCRYNPRGNILGQNIYETGSTCSSCSDTCTTAYLYKGLCPAPN